MFRRMLTGRGLLLGIGILSVAGCAPVAFLTVDDAIVTRESEVSLVAHLQREPFPSVYKDIEDVDVHFSVAGERVGSDRTGERGRAEVNYTLPCTRIATFAAEASVKRKSLGAVGRIFSLEPEQTILVVDVDETLSVTDYKSLLWGIGRDDSAPLPGALETLVDLADNYHIVYLTARPRSLQQKTRRWLEVQGFPAGPVLAAPRLRDFLQQKRFKRRLLADKQNEWDNMLIGIGDKPTDARAYRQNDMLAIVVNPWPGQRYNDQDVVLTDWYGVAAFFREYHRLLSNPDKLGHALAGPASPIGLSEHLDNIAID
jgi:hypothetical protein